MHGRVKVRTSQEQQAQKHKEQQKKLAAYRIGFQQILSTRNPHTYDENSLNLSSQLLALNPDIYTLWNYRKECITMRHKLLEHSSETERDSQLDEFCSFLENELKLTEQCLIANPKSYGSWHHRYWVLNMHPKPNWQQEFNLCTKYSSLDDRNFHCWDFRRLIVNKIGITLVDELKFSTERLNVNFSNYSSWHYRSTLLGVDKAEGRGENEELKLVQNAVFTDPSDTSAWFYLRWIIFNFQVKDGEQEEFLANLEQLEELEPDCRWVLLAKCWMQNRLNFFISKQLCTKLVELDPMRKGYYTDILDKSH